MKTSMYRKIVAIGMCATMALSAGSGIAFAESEELGTISKDGRKVIDWHASYLNGDVTTKFADLYNQSQDEVYVEVTDGAYGSTSEYFEALAVNAASGEGWDIFSMSSAYFNKYAGSGIAYNVDDYILNNDDVKEYAKEAVSRDGHAYAFPATNDVIGLFVNTDMLEGSGHTLDDLKTWDGMLSVAADISKKYDNYGCLTNVDFGGGYAEYLWYSTMWSAGGDINSDLSGNITVTNPDGVAKGAEMYRDLITGEGGSSEFNNDIDYFVNGMCGMVITGQTGLFLIDQAEADFNWTFVPIPAGDTNQSYATLGGWFVFVNANSKYAREAADFLNWLYFDSDYVAELCNVNFQLSPLNSADKKLDSLYVDTKFKLAYDLIQSGAIKCKAELAFDSEVLEAIGEMLSAVVFDTTTHEEAVECVNTFIETVGATVAE